MATTENIYLKLLSQVLINDEPLEFNYQEVIKNHEFFKLLKENLTKEKEEEYGNLKQ